jgi:hypothetical protein
LTHHLPIRPTLVYFSVTRSEERSGARLEGEDGSFAARRRGKAWQRQAIGRRFCAWAAGPLRGGDNGAEGIFAVDHAKPDERAIRVNSLLRWHLAFILV